MARDAFKTIKSRWPYIHELLLKSPPIQGELTFTSTSAPAPVFKGIQLCSGFDRIREAQMQATLAHEDAKEITIYGFVTGDLPLLLLKRPLLERINIVLLNLSLTVALIDITHETSWLDDERVSLFYGGDETLPRFPFTAIPPCLQFADRASERISDLVRLELSTFHINNKNKRDASNYLHSRLEEHTFFIRNDKDVASLFGTQKNATILVAGAGPTISQTADLLANLHKNYILIAVDAVLKSLISKNIYPDYTITIDPNAEIADLFFIKNTENLTKNNLIYFPTVHTHTINSWKGPRYTAYTHSKIYDRLRSEYPKGELFSSGSVIHPAVDLAVKMGCKEIILFGTDFSFPNEMTHAEECSIRKKIDSNFSGRKVINGHGKYVHSQTNLIGYLRDLEVYIQNNKSVNFINTSKEGANIQGTHYYIASQVSGLALLRKNG